MRKKFAFTLIELLIVVAIIGILAAIAVPNFLNAQMKARLAQVESNMKALSTSMMTYQVDWGSLPLHDPAHNQNILGNGLTTPVAYIAKVPLDIFQTGNMAETTQMFSGGSGRAAEIHPEPFYAPSFGHPALDNNVPPIGSGGDLTLRFIDDPALLSKARSQYFTGRYLVSVGPDQRHNYPGTYHISNGLNSSGDMIRVVP